MSEERREYLELLEELVAIPSPSQHEKTMASRDAPSTASRTANSTLMTAS